MGRRRRRWEVLMTQRDGPGLESGKEALKIIMRGIPPSYVWLGRIVGNPSYALSAGEADRER
jgi:hypothetical protein